MVCGCVVMMISAQSLWRLNHEYNQRLSRARNYVALLERLVIARNLDEQPQLMAALGYIRDQLDTIHEQHRDWRYHYFYNSPENKRMVHQEREVGRAMTQFARMRVDHERNLAARFGKSGFINKEGTRAAMVIPTNEELVIAQDASRLTA